MKTIVHGDLSKGYRRGCKCDACRRANNRSQKLYRCGVLPKLIPAVGTHRRIQSLAAIGWTYGEIAAACGSAHREWTREVLLVDRVHEHTAARVARAYDAMSMTVPAGPMRSRGRRLAARKGWVPPLAWDDIDDPDEQPALGRDRLDHDQVDHAVVERILGGEWRLTATRAEKETVAARWHAQGRPMRVLEELTGWNISRYYDARQEPA